MADLVRSRVRRGSSGGGSARRPHSRGAPRTPPPTGWSPHRPPADRSREVKDRLRQADAAHAASRYRRAEATAAAAAADSFEEHAAQRRQWRQQQVEAQLLEQERTSRAQHQGREYRAAQRHLLLDDEQELERTRAELQASRKSKAARSSRGERQGRLKPPSRAGRAPEPEPEPAPVPAPAPEPEPEPEPEPVSELEPGLELEFELDPDLWHRAVAVRRHFCRVYPFLSLTSDRNSQSH
jgi:hypothetical protein